MGIRMTGDDADATTDAAEAMTTEPVVEVFSRPAAVRILVALADAGGNDLSPGDIADIAGISRNAWYENRDMLLEHGFIEQTRKAGNAKLYAADVDAEPMQAFIHLYDALGAHDSEHDATT